MKKILFCSVGGQVAPNLLPIWDDNVDLLEVAFLYVSDSMQDKGESLRALFERAGFERIEIIPCRDAENIVSCQQELQAMLMVLDELYGKDAYQMHFNLAGGTKIQTLCAFEIAKKVKDSKYLYSDRQGRLHQFCFGSEFEQLETSPLDPNKFDLQAYLEGYGSVVCGGRLTNGFRHEGAIEQKHSEEALKSFAVRLATTKNQKFYDFSEWHSLANNPLVRNDKAGEKQFCGLKGCYSQWIGNGKPKPYKIKPKEQTNPVAKKFIEAGICHIDDTQRLVFETEAERNFAGGIWFEYAIYAMIEKLQRKYEIKALSHSVKTCKNIGGTSNEVDIMFFAKDTLYLIECKAQGFNNPKAKEKFNDIVDKFAHLERLGGIQTKMAIVSLFDWDTKALQYATDKKVDAFAMSKGSFDQWFDQFIKQPKRR